MKRIPAVFLLLIAGACFGGESSPPNFVFVIVDDLGRQDLTVFGSSYYETPNMDRLAEEGMRFDNAYAAHPRCVPSRLGIMSGRYPARYGIPGFPDRKEGNHALPLSATTFAERLREAGYRTGYIGKWHLGKEGGDPGAQGFDTTIMAGAPGATPSFFLPYEKPRGKDEAVQWVSYTGGEPGEYLTDRLMQEAIDFIDREKTGPFLLVLAHYAVHTPIQAPEEISEAFRRKARVMELEERWDADIVRDGTGEVKTQQNHPVYAAMIERVDAGVGKLVDKLEQEGLSDNTVVILTSDEQPPVPPRQGMAVRRRDSGTADGQMAGTSRAGKRLEGADNRHGSLCQHPRTGGLAAAAGGPRRFGQLRESVAGRGVRTSPDVLALIPRPAAADRRHAQLRRHRRAMEAHSMVFAGERGNRTRRAFQY